MEKKLKGEKFKPEHADAYVGNIKPYRGVFVGKWINSHGKDEEFTIIVESYSQDAGNAVSDYIMKSKTDTIHDMDVGPANLWVQASENLWGDRE